MVKKDTRRPDPAERRQHLTRCALELLEGEGPDALTTRKVAARASTSTMAVYSVFGSVGGLVASVVAVGFAKLDLSLSQAGESDDPLRDLWGLATAYRGFARERPHLFSAMYGVSRPGGYVRTGEELLLGADVFERHLRVTQRAIETGHLADAPPYDVALTLWTALHGHVIVELAGYLSAMPAPSSPLLEQQFARMLVGCGVDPERARAAVGSPD